MGRAYREGRLDRRVHIYLAPKVLVSDKVAYLPLDDLGTMIFLQLVSPKVVPDANRTPALYSA